MDSITFECPTCGARHQRGYVNGTNSFRCLACGYEGHGFHADPETDREAYRDHVAGNMELRRLGLPEVPLGVDPLSAGN